jgi:hypothetical protein
LRVDNIIDMIKNKRVLLICKESFSFPLAFIAQDLLNLENNVGVFFINPEESYQNKSLFNENTFYHFKENLKQVKLFGLQDLCREFNDSLSNPIINMSKLSEIEQEYTHFKNLNLQATSSQLLTRHYHSRDYFSLSTYEQSLKFIELGYSKVLDVIDEFKPDVILDIDDAELLRTIMVEVAFKKRIPYITIDYPRFKNYKIPTFNLGLKYENYFIEKYNHFLKEDQANLKVEYEYILGFRNRSKIMPDEFKGTITSQYKPNSILYTLKYLLGKFFYFWNVSITNRNYKLYKKKNILYTNLIKHFLFYVRLEIKKQILLRKNKYFVTPDKDDIYVYMPLHLIPESTTFVKAPFYIDELHIISQVSKSLPIGYFLYVKEHQSMLGERSLDFYNKVKRFPNVKLVQLNYYDDPKPWIEKAQGVITIAGTSAYEAALLGKRSVLFSDVPFSLIKGITRAYSFEELPKLISNFGSIDNIKSCAAYLATVKSVGSQINLKYLMTESEAILKGKKKKSNEFQKQIDELMKFFEKALIQYKKNE